MTRDIEKKVDVLLLKVEVLYDVEKVLEKALPKLEKAAFDKGLKSAFRQHLAETEDHIVRLEKIFSELDAKPNTEKSEGIRGIAADSEWVIKTYEPSLLRDCMLASGARYAEHYEMAGYLSAIEEAKVLKMPHIAKLLRENLKEEMAADKILAGGMKAALRYA